MGCSLEILSGVSTSSELLSCTDTMSEDNMATPQRLTIAILPSYILPRVIDNFQALTLCFPPSKLNEKTWIGNAFDNGTPYGAHPKTLECTSAVALHCYNISIIFVLHGELFCGTSDVAMDGYTCSSWSEALINDVPPKTFTIWTGLLISSMLNMSSIIDLPQPTQTSIHESLVKEADQVTRHKNDHSEFKCRGRRCRPFVGQTTWRYRRGHIWGAIWFPLHCWMEF